MKITLPYSSWSGGSEEMEFVFPEGIHLDVKMPVPQSPLTQSQIDNAVKGYLRPLLEKKKLAPNSKVVIVVDDITRPTPAYKILPVLLLEIQEFGLERQNIQILIGTGAHRPMTKDELTKKLGVDVLKNYPVSNHDFLNSKLHYYGTIKGGGVYLNKLFFDAQLRITLGSVMPHNETGFGGASKLVVPGIAGAHTIAHFHGALKARRSGHTDSSGYDRRCWIEEVVEDIGLDMSICAVIDSHRNITGLFASDPKTAYKQASQHAMSSGITHLKQTEIDSADVILVNTYPLDSDPIQMGKAINLANKIPDKLTLVINSATDGIFYHGLGMGMGFEAKRFLRNLSSVITDRSKFFRIIRTCIKAFPSPELIARSIYFYFNQLSYSDFCRKYNKASGDANSTRPLCDTSLMVYSPSFPAWGFKQRYPKGLLYADWQEMCKDLLKKTGGNCRVLVFPTAPLQLIKII